jgi:signal transduction histidine kinase
VGYFQIVENARSLIRRFWLDAAVLAASIGAVIELERASGTEAPHRSVPFYIFVTAVIAGPLFARRQFPLAGTLGVFVGAASTSFLEGRLVPYSGFLFLISLFAALLVGANRERLHALGGYAILLALVFIVGSQDPGTSGSDWFFIPFIFTLFWGGGYALGAKLRQVEAAEERAARLEREREVQAEAAVADERARIARELHDIVGHSVSVMTVQASAVRRLLRDDQEKEREALQVVEETGRAALAEMRRLVGVLRRAEESPSLVPQPSLEHVEKLVAQTRDAGLDTELKVEGEPRSLPQGVDLAAYRLVQEGLTNALKHASATRAQVVVRWKKNDVELIVRDDGNGRGQGGGSGHGLVGMRERVAVYGGDLHAGPHPGGGYELRARLPVTAE